MIIIINSRTMDSEWVAINKLRKKLSGGKWKSCEENDMYELSVQVLFSYQKANKIKIYDDLHKIIIPDVIPIIRSFDNDLTYDVYDDGRMNIRYNTLNEKIYHNRILEQLKSWNATNNPMYSILFINNLDHLTDYSNKIHIIDSKYDIHPIDGIIICANSFFDDIDSLYLRTDNTELGRIVGTGIIINDPKSILLIVKYNTRYESNDRIYKANKIALENNTQHMNDEQKVLPKIPWNRIHQILETIGTFYCTVNESND